MKTIPREFLVMLNQFGALYIFGSGRLLKELRVKFVISEKLLLYIS